MEARKLLRSRLVAGGLPPPAPVAAALEGGYNPLVTSECCEAVVRILLGEAASYPTAQILAPTCEPSLREVIEVHRAHWPALRHRRNRPHR